MTADGPEQTFSEKLAERPRARFFWVFSLLGFAVTPAAIAILMVTPSGPESELASPESKGVRIQDIIAAILIAAHALCLYFAWYFWKDEDPARRQQLDEAG